MNRVASHGYATPTIGRAQRSSMATHFRPTVGATLDSRRLEIPGRKRLEMEHGRPISQIIA